STGPRATRRNMASPGDTASGLPDGVPAGTRDLGRNPSPEACRSCTTLGTNDRQWPRRHCAYFRLINNAHNSTHNLGHAQFTLSQFTLSQFTFDTHKIECYASCAFEKARGAVKLCVFLTAVICLWALPETADKYAELKTKGIALLETGKYNEAINALQEVWEHEQSDPVVA